MELQAFCDKHGIDLRVLPRLKRTVILVGQFGTIPGLFSFTNRELSSAYRANFKSVGPAAFEAFLDTVRPTLDLYPRRVGRFEVPEYDLPRPGQTPLSRAPLGVSHPLFEKTTADSDQDEFRGSSRVDVAVTPEPGRETFRQIVADLASWNAMQTRHNELVETLAALLARCAGDEGLPSYAVGAALPGNFVEKALNHFYEDSPGVFSLKGIDFSSRPWDALQTEDAAGRETLAAIVGAFRERLIGARDSQFNAVVLKGQPLPELVDESLASSGQLIEAFRRARAGRAGVRELLRDPPRMALMLRWVIGDAYELVCSKLPEDVERQDQNGNWTQDVHDAVQTAVLEGKHGIPKAVKRPKRDQRRAFEKLLTDNWERVVRAATAETEEHKVLVKDMSEELKSLVEAIRADEQRVHELRMVSGADSKEDPTILNGFISGHKTMMIDILVPALCRTPVLTLRQVKGLLKSSMLSLFFTAVALDARNETAVRRVAERHIKTFEKQIDHFETPTKETYVLVRRLLEDYLKVLARPETVQRLSDAVKAIREVLALQELAEEQKERNLFAALRPHELTRSREKALKRTRPAREHVRVLVSSATAARTAERVAARGRPEPAEAPAAPKPSGGKKPTNGTPPATNGDAAPRLEYQAAIDARVDARLDEFLRDAGSPAAEVGEEDRARIASQVTDELMQDAGFVAGLSRDFEAFDRVAYLIYHRFNDPENVDKKAFRRGTLRMSFLNLLLSFSDDLLLGKNNSHLYALLADMIEVMDGDDPQPREFIRTKSLTEYFEDLSDNGLKEQLDALEVAAIQSSQNLVQYLSDLRGLRYLFDKCAGSPDVELIVFNGSARDFASWMQQDCLKGDEGRGLLRLGKWQKANGASQRSIAPGVICFADSAFPKRDKEAFLRSFAAMPLHDVDSGFSMLVPPVLIGTGPQDVDYRTEGRKLAEAAKGAPFAVHVLGPSPYMNRPESSLPTVLPAGYPALVELLTGAEQRLSNPNVPRGKPGRVHLVGFGDAGFSTSLQKFVWGEAPANGKAKSRPKPDGDAKGEEKSTETTTQPGTAACYEADLFLHLLLSVVGTGKYGGGTVPVDPEAFYKAFHNDFQDPSTLFDYQAGSVALGPALHGEDAHRLALEQPLGDGTPLQAVQVALPSGPNLLSAEARRFRAGDISWFNRAREMAQVP